MISQNVSEVSEIDLAKEFIRASNSFMISGEQGLTTFIQDKDKQWLRFRFNISKYEADELISDKVHNRL